MIQPWRTFVKIAAAAPSSQLPPFEDLVRTLICGSWSSWPIHPAILEHFGVFAVMV